jgi:hypothetical protein
MAIEFINISVCGNSKSVLFDAGAAHQSCMSIIACARVDPVKSYHVDSSQKKYKDNIVSRCFMMLKGDFAICGCTHMFVKQNDIP